MFSKPENNNEGLKSFIPWLTKDIAKYSTKNKNYTKHAWKTPILKM